jgi:predicted ester cyclase/Ca2+-binding RTX toxin-like protein
MNTRRKTIALGVITAVALGLAANGAMAAVSAEVDDGILTISGDGADNRLVLRLAPGSPNTLQVDVGADGTADFSFDRSTFTTVDVKAKGGDDEVRIDQSGGAFTDENVIIRGEGGADTLIGGAGAETFFAGAGDDVVDGNLGQDRAFLGTGDDRFQWDPGDSSDTVEGDGGDDLLDFNGSNAGENVEATANGPRARFTRNIANIVMDLDGIETVDFQALGGADTMQVGDLAGTDLKTVDTDLSVLDGQADTVIARGTEGEDEVELANDGGLMVVDGLAAETRVLGGEETLDNLSVAALGGADTIETAVGITGVIPFNADGGGDADTAIYRGTAADDAIHLVANGAEATAYSPGSARLDTLVEKLSVLGLAGADTITAVGNLAALTSITMDGGDGDDDVRGGNGPDLLIGGKGDDSLDGNQGLDLALLGRGDDRFQWDPGDGNDTVEGQAGEDLLDFNGSNIGEVVELSANGPRARFTRNIANIVMDLDDVEDVTFRAHGGTDTVLVNDLAGTDVEDVDADLTDISGVGDGSADAVIVRGTEGADRISLSSPLAFPIVSGLAAEVLVEGVEPAHDTVNVEALGGDDTITTGREVLGAESYNVDGGLGNDITRYLGTDVGDQIGVVANGAEVSTVAPLASRLDTIAVESLVVQGLAGTDDISAVGNLAALIALTMDGGLDEDMLRGGNGADLLLGGDGTDHVDGNQGADRALLGRGDDRFQWDPGDGNDTVEGQAGIDALDFNGSNAGELMDVSADGGRVRFTRNIANIVMDLDTIESVFVRAFGGPDSITVNDLRSTDVDGVDIDLSANGAGDLAADTVIVNGTNKRDVVDVTRSGSQVLVSGLSALTRIAGSEPVGDTLRIQTLDGRDAVTVAPDVSDLIAAVVDLGAGQ